MMGIACGSTHPTCYLLGNRRLPSGQQGLPGILRQYDRFQKVPNKVDAQDLQLAMIQRVPVYG